MRRLACLALCLSALLPPASRAADDDLPKKAMKILDTACKKCHSGASTNGNFDVLLYKTLFQKSDDARAYVVPKAPAQSYLWEMIRSDEMPQTKMKLSAEEKQVIKDWIEAGAPAPVLGEEKPRAPIGLAETLAAIGGHLRAADREDQPYLRYFLLTSAHNDPRVKDADLRAYRAALSKAINSLTWKRNIVLPEAVDKANTVYAIDLRDLDWDAKPGEKYDRWQAMLKYYPYALDHQGSKDEKVRKAAEEIADVANAKLVYMRADWFVATATREDLYHTILRLPDNAPELEKRLGVDVANNFRRNRLWRSAFTSSGVSAQNRLIERHDSLYGAYWKSYDFKEGGVKSDLLRYPLGPDLSDKYRGKYPYKDAAFAHDGGEVIFNLPNGLQAYFLLDGKDGRISKGPIGIVHDRLETSGTPEIVTGVSCMTCHVKGLIPGGGDVVRESTTVGGLLLAKVRRLYPTHAVLKKKIKEDSELYLSAVEKATGPFLFTEENKKESMKDDGEPIAKWARKYRRELGLEDAAYELGKTPAELKAAIENNAALRNLGLDLLLRGKGLKRAKWEELRGSSQYQQAARILEIGLPLDPQ